MESSTQSPVDSLTSGFHLLKNNNTYLKKRMAEAAAFCSDNLDILLNNTRNQVQVRDSKKNYRLNRNDPDQKGTDEEARLERSLFQQFHTSQNQNTPLLENLCEGLVAYQVPLYNSQNQERWGEIDLLGHQDRLPVVIELKRGSNTTDPLLGMLLQGVAYAVSLQVAWKSSTSGLRDEWISALGIEEISQDLPVELERMPIICLAPLEYWEYWQKQMTAGARDAIERLCERLRKRGYAIEFAVVQDEPQVQYHVTRINPYTLQV